MTDKPNREQDTTFFKFAQEETVSRAASTQPARSERNLIVALVREHSRKPGAA